MSLLANRGGNLGVFLRNCSEMPSREESPIFSRANSQMNGLAQARFALVDWAHFAGKR